MEDDFVIEFCSLGVTICPAAFRWSLKFLLHYTAETAAVNALPFERGAHADETASTYISKKILTSVFFFFHVSIPLGAQRGETGKLQYRSRMVTARPVLL